VSRRTWFVSLALIGAAGALGLALSLPSQEPRLLLAGSVGEGAPEPEMEPLPPFDPDAESQARVDRIKQRPLLIEGLIGSAGSGNTGTAYGAGGLGTKGTGLGGGGLGSSGYGSSGYGKGEGQVRRAPPPSSEHFTDYGTNELVLSATDRLSTFSIDVDTGSYTLARSSLNGGSLPATSAVRVEEFVNYFDYGYIGPTNGAPFAVNMEAAPSPWDPTRHVLRIGVQADRLEGHARKPVRLVFLVDVSGSMSGNGRLELAKQSLTDLVGRLGPEDSVGLVTYAGAVKRVLEPTSCTEKERILQALDELRPGGGTAMGSGIDLAYAMAEEAFVRGAENRVVVLSDGDANVGARTHEQMLESIRGYARRGITLSTVGFGRGNYKDTLMEQLANEGDGNYSYVDSLKEGRRLFGERLGGTIQTVARDVKIQVEFEPEAVLAYRLIGYENRDIADRDFRNDRVDAGEIGSGHSVTALYELVLREDRGEAALATVRLRAKPAGADRPAEEWTTSFSSRLLREELADASPSFRLALGVASFAELLRASPHVEELRYAQVWQLVDGARRPSDEASAELLELIAQAARMSGEGSGLASR